MKKNLLLMEKGSEIRSAIQELSLLKAEALLSTKPFLNVCNLVLQVLDKIGPTMAVLRQDVYQNIQRLEELYQMDPSIYANLADIVKKEVEEESAKKALSCTRALLWLTRSLDFTVALLDKIAQDPSQSLAKVVEISYDNTLKPWHGWISSAAYKVILRPISHAPKFLMHPTWDFIMLHSGTILLDQGSLCVEQVALKLVPDNKAFIRILLAEEEEYNMLKEEIQSLVSLLLPLLDEIHKILEAFRLDRLKST